MWYGSAEHWRKYPFQVNSISSEIMIFSLCHHLSSFWPKHKTKSYVSLQIIMPKHANDSKQKSSKWLIWSTKWPIVTLKLIGPIFDLKYTFPVNYLRAENMIARFRALKTNNMPDQFLKSSKTNQKKYKMVFWSFKFRKWPLQKSSGSIFYSFSFKIN